MRCCSRFRPRPPDPRQQTNVGRDRQIRRLELSHLQFEVLAHLVPPAVFPLNRRAMILKFLLAALVALIGPATLPGSLHAVTIALTVPGTSDLWLAGQPNGTLLGGDNAPDQSPAQVLGLGLTPGTSLTFTASGTVGFPGEPAGPDGSANSYTPPANFGLSSLFAPANALIGVFLDNSTPVGPSAPTGLAFNTAVSRDFSTLSPLLSQTFFIGDGLKTGSVAQQFVVPTGTTRLFLGTLDGFGWFNNIGSFAVTVTSAPVVGVPSAVPESGSTLPLMAGACLTLFIYGARSRKIALPF